MKRKRMRYQEYQAVLLETKKKVRRKIAVLLLVAILLLGLFAAAGMLWHTYQNGLQMQLQGESWITQEYDQEFTDPGATASFDGFFYDQQEIPVTVEGAVNTNQLGLHQLTYTAEYKLDLYTLPIGSYERHEITVNGLTGQLYLYTDMRSGGVLIWQDEENRILFRMNFPDKDPANAIKMANSIQLKEE